MKILVLRTIPFEENNPFNHLLRDIYTELLKNKLQIHRVISIYNGEEPKDVIPLESESAGLSYESAVIPRVSKSNFIIRFMISLWSAYKLSRKGLKNPDISAVFITVPQTAIIPVLLSKRKKKKIVLLLQDIWPNNACEIGLIKKDGLLYRVFMRIQMYVYKNSNAIITISEDMKKLITDLGIPGEKVAIAHNWSYSDAITQIGWEQNKFVEKYSLQDNIFRVVYAGNIGAMQNVEIIIEAANRLRERKDISFIIVGDGVNKKKLCDEVSHLGLENIAFYPMQPPEIAMHIYSIANINIIPLRRGAIRTALPSKTAACLSCGKPIIACIDEDSHFAQTLSSYGAALVVSPDDPEGLVDAILQIKDNKDSLNKMELASYKCFNERFRRDNNVAIYSKVFKILDTSMVKQPILRG